MFLARTRDTDMFDNRKRYSDYDGKKRPKNHNHRVKLLTWEYANLFSKIMCKFSCMYKYRLDRFQYIYKYIEQAVE